MRADLLICRKKAMAEHQRQSGQNISPGCRRKGYMELMRLSWEEKGYASLGLTTQILRDKAAQLVKNEERSRQEYTNANGEVNMNEEANNAVEMTTTGLKKEINKKINKKVNKKVLVMKSA